MNLLLPLRPKNSVSKSFLGRRSGRFLTGALAPIALISLGAAASARADEIDDYVAAQMSRQHIPGLSLAVVQDGKPVKVAGYGQATREPVARATPETVYQIGSISKQFIAAGILRLNADGKVGLDDPIRQYLEDAPDSWQPITIRQLLNHTAGLVRETPGMQLKAQPDIDAIRAAYALPLAFAPGEKWQYSNLGYFVLAEVISRRAQMPWPQYVQTQVFTPLGMAATHTTAEAAGPQVATGYNWMETGDYQKTPVFPGVRPSGAFASTVRDLAKWDAALYSDAVLSSAQRELMWTPAKLTDGSEKPYGFGWELAKIGKHRVAKHAGTMLGFRSQILRLPDDRLTIIILANATNAVPEKIAQGIATHYLPDLKADLPKRSIGKLPAETLDRYAGRYKLGGSRLLTVARREDKLAVSMALPAPGPDTAALVKGVSMEVALLTPESETRFFDEDDRRATYVFSQDAQGQLQLAVEAPNGKMGPPSPKLP